jgi:hypothetical protein
MEKYKLDFDQVMQLIAALLRNDVDADIRRLVASLGGHGDIVIELDSSARGRARLSILGSDADIEELCVRVCTFQPSALPISSFAQLVVKSKTGNKDFVSREVSVPISIEALFGIAVGELITRLNGMLSGEWLSYGRLSRTYSYCYAQANQQKHTLPIEDIWNRWRDTRRMLGNEDPLELENEIFACIGLIEQARGLRGSRANSGVFDVLATDKPTVEIVNQLRRRLPSIQPYLLEFDGALENRLRGFDKCVQAIQELHGDAIEQSIFVAALANQILPGSGAYFHVLRPLAQNYPGLFVWYGYLSGCDGGRGFTESFASVFRKFVDAIEVSNTDAAFKANVDYCELQVLYRAREVESIRRVTEGSFVVIDLGLGLLAQVPFAARMEGKGGLDVIDMVPREHVELLLSEAEKILKLGEQFGYGRKSQNSTLDKPSKSKPANSRKSKNKPVKEDRNLF